MLTSGPVVSCPWRPYLCGTVVGASGRHGETAHVALPQTDPGTSGVPLCLGMVEEACQKCLAAPGSLPATSGGGFQGHQPWLGRQVQQKALPAGLSSAAVSGSVDAITAARSKVRPP